MTSNLSRALRRSARAATVAFLTVSVVTGAPALAKPPEGWSDPASVDPSHLLMILFGFPLIVFAIAAAIIVVPGLARGEKLGHSNEHVLENTWLGGPRRELEAGQAPTHRAGGGEPALEGREDTGGASGSW